MSPAPGTPARRPCGVVLAACVATLTLGVSACGGDPRSVAGFCNLLRKNGAALTDTSDPAGLAELYRSLDSHAPLQIMDQWHEVTALMARVTTFNPQDDKDTQALISESLRARSSINAVAAWADSKCKVPLGHITVPPDSTPSASATSDSTPADSALDNSSP